MTEIKRCGKCGQEKPLSDFYRRSEAKDGRKNICKKCCKERDRDWSRNYYALNREEILRQYRAYYWLHRERAHERCRAYDKSHRKSHGEEERERHRIYYAAHSEEKLKWHRDYRKSHPEIDRAKEERRRARKLKAFGTEYTTSTLIEGRREAWGSLCWICGKPADAMDHVKPLAKGGAHLPCNLRPICTICNSRKGANWPYVVSINGYVHG